MIRTKVKAKLAVYWPPIKLCAILIGELLRATAEDIFARRPKP